MQLINIIHTGLDDFGQSTHNAEIQLDNGETIYVGPRFPGEFYNTSPFLLLSWSLGEYPGLEQALDGVFDTIEEAKEHFSNSNGNDCAEIGRFVGWKYECIEYYKFDGFRGNRGLYTWHTWPSEYNAAKAVGSPSI